MPVYSLIQYSDNYSIISGSLCQYHRYEPTLNSDDTLDNFPGNSASFKLKQKTIGSTKAVQIVVPMKYLSNCWRTLEMPLINCEINLILTWSANCFTFNTATNQAITFAITDIKLYVPVVTLSTQDNAKQLQQLKLGFKRTTNWNIHHSKTEPLNAPKPHLDFLINSGFQEVNRLFVLAFNANDSMIGHWIYYLPTARVKDYNVMMDGKYF